ncbi:ATP-binding protein [Mariniflexile litorale]|uniref:histidine kinase n=1 Tax=Mariniflexile litorale TaxID=3045158 RepID=A0AAU7EDE0_9FLAO|nr:ATP-binding protein [Mariniflexile sp. KMM 9835]MDQ8211652.1 ATP-binding protein [Mariniflexile sp. KMM 9835]
MSDKEDLLRTNALQELNSMYTPPEKMFDDITSLAAFICDTPIALISLVDDKNQFFISHYGLDVNKTAIKEVFCTHAIKADEAVFIVEDATIDKRFKDHPLLLSNPNIVYYAGVPLVNEEGLKIGTLCVIDKFKRLLDKNQIKALKNLSNQVIYLLKLRESNNALKSYKLKLEDSYKRSSEFSTMAAHDLKSPMNGIKSFIDIINSKYKNVWDDKDEQYLKFIFENIQRMNSLIIGLLEYSKSDIDVINKERIDLEKLVKKVYDLIIQDLSITNAKLITSNLPIIISSEIAITTLFQNLMVNALKFQNKGANPEIQVTCEESEFKWIFSIEDNGIGIDAEHFNIIFNPFKRLHNQSQFSGSGLGLSTCKKIVESLKGELRVSSLKNKGSIFVIDLPKN